MASDRSPKETTDPRKRYEFSESEHATRIAPSFATLSLGGFSLALAGVAWTPILDWLAWIDLPVVFLLFLICAWVSLIDLRAAARSLPGLIMSATAVVLSLAHLILDPTHPWAG